jgi:hypothetical protein
MYLYIKEKGSLVVSEEIQSSNAMEDWSMANAYKFFCMIIPLLF